jgi:hypothetical protein
VNNASGRRCICVACGRADVPRKNVEALALRLLGVSLHSERQVRALQQFIELWGMGR